MSIFFMVKNGLSNFIADVTARYNLYVARENRKLQQQQASHAQMLAMQAMQADYYCIGSLLMDAIKNTAPLTQLIPVQDMSQLFVINWLTKSPRELWVLNYRALRNSYNIPDATVQKILQHEIDQLCGYHGVPSQCLRVKSRSDYRVLIQVVDATAAARKPVTI